MPLFSTQSDTPRPTVMRENSNPSFEKKVLIFCMSLRHRSRLIFCSHLCHRRGDACYDDDFYQQSRMVQLIPQPAERNEVAKVLEMHLQSQTR